MRRNLILFAWILIVGCSAFLPDKMMDSWMGATEQQLISVWGPPTRTDSDGGSGKVLTYTFTENWVSPYFVPGQLTDNGNGTATYRPPRQDSGTSVKVRQFYVNAEGRIYSWRYQGI